MIAKHKLITKGLPTISENAFIDSTMSVSYIIE